MDSYEEGTRHSRNSSSSSVPTSTTERDRVAFASWEGETVLDRARKLLGQLAKGGPLPVDGLLKRTLDVMGDMRETSDFGRLPQAERNTWEYVALGLKDFEAIDDPWAIALEWRRWTKGQTKIRDFWLLIHGSGVDMPMDTREGDRVGFERYDALEPFQESYDRIRRGRGKYHRPSNWRENLRRAGVQLDTAREGEPMGATAAIVEERPAKFRRDSETISWGEEMEQGDSTEFRQPPTHSTLGKRREAGPFVEFGTRTEERNVRRQRSEEDLGARLRYEERRLQNKLIKARLERVEYERQHEEVRRDEQEEVRRNEQEEVRRKEQEVRRRRQLEAEDRQKRDMEDRRRRERRETEERIRQRNARDMEDRRRTRRADDERRRVHEQNMDRQARERDARLELKREAAKERDRQNQVRQTTARDRATAEAGLGVRMRAFSAIAEKLAETPRVMAEEVRAVEEDLPIEHLELLWDPTEDPPEPRFMGDLIIGKVLAQHQLFEVNTFPSQLAREVRPRITSIVREELKCVARTPEEYLTMLTRIRHRVDLTTKEEICKMMDGEVYEKVTWKEEITRSERKKRVQYYLKARAAEFCRAAEGHAKEVEDDAAILEESDIQLLINHQF